ncbi:MAG: hypothetical protein HQK65_14940 [Desulfamplus sp.]|nr:hypothetical protein [Desulfamplus sp.]
MPVTVQNVKVEEFFDFFQKKYNIKPEQKFTITFDVKDIEPVDFEDEVVDVKQDLMDGFQEIIEARKKGVRLPDAHDLLKEL